MNIKQVYFSIILAIIFMVPGLAQIQQISLKDKLDTLRVLENPHKGWYHHYYDNGHEKYLLENDEDLTEFPGMDHIYIRLSWNHFEPQEGNFDWHWIDDLKKKWTPKGFKFSFRITSKESNEKYATPKWVREAGAKGKFVKASNGTEIWAPDYNDSIFLSKLEKFHKVFSERYDGKDWITYIDIGSVGTWGEGHEYPDFTFQPDVQTNKKIIDLHKKAYKKTPLVVTDDYAHQGNTFFVTDQPQRNEIDELRMREYIEKNEISWRDDTPLVAWFVDNRIETYGVVRPEFFNDTYRKQFTILEADHYISVKSNNNWIGKNGSLKGRGILRGALETTHATYIGFHGYAHEYMEENPELIKELANRCGYWYFPISLRIADKLSRRKNNKMSISWENRGVAPAYKRYLLYLKLKGPTTTTILLPESDNTKWLDNETTIENYTVKLPNNVKKGLYTMAIKLYDPTSKRNIEIGLKEDIKDNEGFYEIFKVPVR